MSNDFVPPLPDNWDWVTERNKCSAVTVFEGLLSLAHSQVKTRNQQSEMEAKHERFRINELQHTRSFAVIDTFGLTRRVVAFETDGDPPNAIRVRKTGVKEHAVYSLTLNDKGQCRLTVGGLEFAPWQVMRRGLESLFFTNPDHDLS